MSVLTGYFVSCLIFNLVDTLNTFILPASLFTSEIGLVGRLVSGETTGGWFTKFVGALAPCVSAPWWEEVRQYEEAAAKGRRSAQRQQPYAPTATTNNPSPRSLRSRPPSQVLYRGFLYPSLHLLLPPLPSLLLSSLIFSTHHLSLTSLLPLWALGVVWGKVYKETGNLWVTTAIHALWNARVFIGGWAGV